MAQHQVILSGDMNTEAIIAKLMWALGKTNKLEEIKKLLKSLLVYDLTIKSDKDW